MERRNVDRIDRINILLKEEIAEALRGNFESLGLLSVLHVETQRDLAEAQVFVVLHDAGDRGEVIETAERMLQEHEPEIWQRLRKILHVKRVPRLRFLLNKHDASFMVIENLFERVDQSGHHKHE